ncbi:MAG: aminotransferase class V-fold PLP-dependent enzyme [Cyanobacteria bacterium J06598_1]
MALNNMGTAAQLSAAEQQAAETLQQHRRQFSSLAGKQYFNYGGQGPMADSAIAALSQGQQTIQTKGPFSAEVYEWILGEGERVRGAISAALGATPETITLTENVTVGCNIPLWGLPWQAGDHILMGDCEHPGVVAAVRELCRRYDVTVSTCPLLSNMLAGADPVGVIAKGLRPETRLVILSHILWNTGQVLPMKAIASLCHANAAHTRLLIDAAQSVGSLPLDQPGWRLPETGVDFYAFTGHKWWGGPAGLGALYVRPEVFEEIVPTYIGWRGVEVDSTANPTGWEKSGRKFEVATSDYSLWGSLCEAITVQASWGDSQARYDRICSLSKRLWAGLRALPNVRCLLQDAPPPSGLVSFQLLDAGGEPDFAQHGTLAKQLEGEKIYVRTLLSPNCVRACVHYLTTEEEIADLIIRIQTVAEKFGG